jgi:hypothetical protein
MENRAGEAAEAAKMSEHMEMEEAELQAPGEEETPMEGGE